MINRDMDQIRELLIGDFVQETRRNFEQLHRSLYELKEQHDEEIKLLQETLSGKIDQLERTSHEKYEYLRKQFEMQLDEHNQTQLNQLESLKEDLTNHKEYTNKSLNLLKKITDTKLQTLRDELSDRSVSKTSLASMFLEYSLKLKDSDIQTQIQKEFIKDDTK